MRETNRKLKSTKGITLIALVITIIVLLILAGVAISMLSGENGILNQAAKAKTETEKKSTEEQVKLAATSALMAGVGKVDLGELNNELKKIKGYVDEGDISTLPATITVGEDKYTINEDGTISTTTDTEELPEVKAGEYANQKSKYVDSNNQTAIIPEGFTVSNVKTDTVDETTIKSGLVIYKGDISATEDMTTCKTTNDQFVWIPVDDPSTMYGIKENGEYWGKLYEFNSDGTTTHLNWYDEIEVTDEELQQAQDAYDAELNQAITDLTLMWDDNPENTQQFIKTNLGITVTTKAEMVEAINTFYETNAGPRPTKDSMKNQKLSNGSREPDYLINTGDGDASIETDRGLNLLKSIIGIEGTIGTDNEKMLNTWKTQLQTEYKEMIESVEKYKGFYVGRYETSLDTTTKKTQVKSGEKASIASDNDTKTWYGLYQNQKEYSTNNNLTDIVGSTMIWGSQYDQMLIWMQNNNINVTENIGDNRNLGKDNSKNYVGTTGTIETDKANNIYDLYGNGYEWTLEAVSDGSRYCRGGVFYRDIDGLDFRESQPPYYAYVQACSRITLYIR